MKRALQHTICRSLISMILAAASACYAGTAVFSNLVDNSEGNSCAFTNSAGTPLAVGSWVRLGTFNNLTPTAVANLATQGKSVLLAAFQPLGEPTPMGAGAGDDVGRVEFAVDYSTPAPSGPLHLVVFNAPSPEAATEVLIAKFAVSLPADDTSGLLGYMAVHLSESTPVIGGIGGVFATVPLIGSTFTSWMSAMGAGGLPEADADQDGNSNLLEYALGSHPSQNSSRAATEMLRVNDTLRFRFLCRNDDFRLNARVETSSDLDAASWIPLEKPPTVLLDPPSPAPAGYIWLEAEIPATEARCFARVRVVLAS